LGAIIQQPLNELAVGMITDAPAGRVAAVFFAYQLIGSLTCTIAFQPLLRRLKQVAPQSPLQEMSKPAFLLDDALVDPSLALELATKEEGRLAQRLPMMLDEIRSDTAPRGSTPDALRSASHSVAEAMAAIGRRKFDVVLLDIMMPEFAVEP
jgi:hypothetical protein